MVDLSNNRKVDDSTQIQTANIDGIIGTRRKKVERAQNYGVTSVPPVDAGAVSIPIGTTDRRVIIVMDDAGTRPLDLKSGEVAVYSMFGQKIHFTEDGGFSLEDGFGNTMVGENGKVMINGNLEVLK